MNKTFKKFIVALLIASLFVFPMVGVNGGVQAQDSFPPALEPYLSADGLTLYNGVAPLVVVVDPNPAMQGIKIPAPEVDKALADPDATSATFSFTFKVAGTTDLWGAVCQDFPAAAQTAFNAAAAIWTSTLQSSVPIKISACWSDELGSTTLGYSGGQPLHRNFLGAPQWNTWYEGALANALSGSDLDPRFDMYITYNSNFAWYYGTDSNTPAGQYDLVTVAAHEIAHGLNFSGSASYSGITGSYGYGTVYPNIYDTFMENSSGTKLTTFTNPSTALGSLFTSGSLWFNGTNANAANTANGSSRVKMYAPPSWSKGSSYAHLDYSTFAGTTNKMMVYAVGSGSANHNPGLVTTGLLKDLGWVLAGESTATISGNAGVDGAILSYTDGTPTTATAIGSGLYSFAVPSGWSGTVTPSKTGYTFSPVNQTYTNILANQTSQDYTASLNTYLLSVSKTGTGSGTVTSSPGGINCGATCSALFNYNTSVTLTATAASGSTFNGWSGSGCSGIGTCTVTVTAAALVSANFRLGTFYTLSVSKSGAGSGTITSSPAGIDCGSTCSYSFDYNTVVTLTATAATGSTFTGLNGSGCSDTVPCPVTMDAAKSVTANFTLNTYALSVSKTGTGIGTVTSDPAGIHCGSDCSETYNYNTSVTLTATASTGSTFTGWGGSSCSGTGTCTVTMSAAKSVTANFDLNTYRIYLPLVIR